MLALWPEMSIGQFQCTYLFIMNLWHVTRAVAIQRSHNACEWLKMSLTVLRDTIKVLVRCENRDICTQSLQLK